MKVGGSTIANVLDRSNHTGSQAISTITNLQTTLTSLADDIDDLADDITALQSGKFDKPTGSTSQYIRGDGSLATMPASAVLSVAGKTGAVTLDTNDISGLGNSATRNVGTTSGTVAAGDDSRITGAVQSSGDTMTGALTLSGNPTNNLHAATKQYVDNAVASVPIPVGLYTGSTSDETNLPVGHHVLLEGSVARNASSPVSLSAGSSYSSSASGSQLSGTWRARGRISLGGSNYGTLMQRTA